MSIADKRDDFTLKELLSLGDVAEQGPTRSLDILGEVSAAVARLRKARLALRSRNQPLSSA